MMDDNAGPQSIFVVVSWDDRFPLSSSILQLKTPNNCESAPRFKPIRRSSGMGITHSTFSSLETQLNQKEYIAHFGQPKGSALITWAFALSTSSTSTEELCLVPYWDELVPLRGCMYNLLTKTIRPSMPPKASRFYGHVASLNGYVYFPGPSFERYDPANDSWNDLAPFPLGSSGSIVATAVLKDTILFNMGSCEIWAYDVQGDKWYRVTVSDSRCLCIAGEAVVIENTIYALTTLSFDLVLALSLDRNENGGFQCCLRARIVVPDIKPFLYMDDTAYFRNKHLVHLGEDKFCLVQSCKLEGFNDYQPIQLTNIKLTQGKSMTVTGECIHLLRILGNKQFDVRLCFSRPECKTTALKEGERFLFDLDPFPEGLKKIDLASRGRLQHAVAGYASPRGNTTEEGSSIVERKPGCFHLNISNDHAIYVRDLSPDATYSQLKKALQEFGALKRLEVILKDTGRDPPYAFAEFGYTTSKQNALKASRVMINGCEALIEDFSQGTTSLASSSPAAATAEG